MLPWAPQGTSRLREDDMSLKAAKIPPGGRLRRGSGQGAWDYPEGSRLFAHATDTDVAVTPSTAVCDCLGARTTKNRQQLKLGKGA
jgi:hypothetical protein